MPLKSLKLARLTDIYEVKLDLTKILKKWPLTLNVAGGIQEILPLNHNTALVFVCAFQTGQGRKEMEINKYNIISLI